MEKLSNPEDEEDVYDNSLNLHHFRYLFASLLFMFMASFAIFLSGKIQQLRSRRRVNPSEN